MKASKDQQKFSGKNRDLIACTLPSPKSHILLPPYLFGAVSQGYLRCYFPGYSPYFAPNETYQPTLRLCIFFKSALPQPPKHSAALAPSSHLFLSTSSLFPLALLSSDNWQPQAPGNNASLFRKHLKRRDQRRPRSGVGPPNPPAHPPKSSPSPTVGPPAPRLPGRAGTATGAPSPRGTTSSLFPPGASASRQPSPSRLAGQGRTG